MEADQRYGVQCRNTSQMLRGPSTMTFQL